jgi:hypothetical protein
MHTDLARAQQQKAELLANVKERQRVIDVDIFYKMLKGIPGVTLPRIAYPISVANSNLGIKFNLTGYTISTPADEARFIDWALADISQDTGVPVERLVVDGIPGADTSFTCEINMRKLVVTSVIAKTTTTPTHVLSSIPWSYYNGRNPHFLTTACCLGSYKTAMDQALQDFDFETLVCLLHHFASRYNTQDPAGWDYFRSNIHASMHAYATENKTQIPRNPKLHQLSYGQAWSRFYEENPGEQQ